MYIYIEREIYIYIYEENDEYVEICPIYNKNDKHKMVKHTINGNSSNNVPLE